MDEPRKKALVVYESLFGNTRRIAEAIGAGVREHFAVDVVEVSHADSSPDVALLVVGGPIHAFGMTRPATRADAQRMAQDKGLPLERAGEGMREWLEKLEVSHGHIDAAAFDTAGKLGWFVVGSAARGEASALSKKGYHLVTTPEHFLVKDIAGPLLDGELERATAWGRTVAASALAPHGAEPRALLPGPLCPSS